MLRNLHFFSFKDFLILRACISVVKTERQLQFVGTTSKNSFNSSFSSDDLKKDYIKKVEQIINNEKTKGQI